MVQKKVEKLKERAKEDKMGWIKNTKKVGICFPFAHDADWKVCMKRSNEVFEWIRKPL
ncbi:hypothetical protein [Bacillus xiapuensis]|uniref:hypothetical protein n=1 Tax=Bacillus xiapuensis TaxID=2014075 RepID=UPI0018E1E095|nr:hypothetical protein [Bacillus xiapuensis]